MLALQAYLGSSPGKLLLGVAVVHETDGRPIGFLRTVLRWALHLFDSILLVGFLRPLWHPYRQTYADSLVHTVALSTRSPRLHPWFARRAPRTSGFTTDGRAPGWRRAVTAAAAVVCVGAGAFAVGPTESRSSERYSQCTVASPGTGSMRLVDGSVTLQPDTVTMTRFGVERRSTVGPEAGVRVAWLWDGQVPDGDVVLRLVLTGA